MTVKNRTEEHARRRIREVRRRRGMQQRELAERSGLTQSAISRIEPTENKKSKESPRRIFLDDLLAIACALNVSPADLLFPAIDPDEQPNETEPDIELAPGRIYKAWQVRSWFGGTEGLHDDDRDRFFEEAPTQVRRAHAVWRQPAMFAMTTLRPFLIDGYLRDRFDQVAPEVLAEAIRDNSARLKAYCDLLADELDVVARERATTKKSATARGRKS